MCISLSVFGFVGSNTYQVMALTAKEQQAHRKKHKNEKEKNITKSGNETTKEYEDGCKYISYTVKDVDNGPGHWEYCDGTTTQDKDTDDEDEALENAEAPQGGKLLTPIFDLLVTLGDGIMHVLQKAITGTDSEITIDLSTSIIGMVIGIIAAIAAMS